jgi:hypothetical protein
MDIEILCDLLGSLPFFNAAPEFQLGVDCIDKTPCCGNKIVVLLPQFQEFRPRSPRDRYPVVGPTYEGQDDCFFVPVNYSLMRFAMLSSSVPRSSTSAWLSVSGEFACKPWLDTRRDSFGQPECET